MVNTIGLVIININAHLSQLGYSHSYFSPSAYYRKIILSSHCLKYSNGFWLLSRKRKKLLYEVLQSLECSLTHSPLQPHFLHCFFPFFSAKATHPFLDSLWCIFITGCILYILLPPPRIDCNTCLFFLSLNLRVSKIELIMRLASLIHAWLPF